MRINRQRTLDNKFVNNIVNSVAKGSIDAEIVDGQTKVVREKCNRCKKGTLFPITIGDKIYCPNCAQKIKE